jgi:hypothetical protein
MLVVMITEIKLVTPVDNGCQLIALLQWSVYPTVRVIGVILLQCWKFGFA